MRAIVNGLTLLACLATGAIPNHPGLAQQAPAPRRVAAVAPATCPVAVRSADIVSAEQGDVLRVKIATTAEDPLQQVELSVMVYSAVGRPVLTVPYYVDDADLPRSGAASTVVFPAPATDDTQFVRVGVSSVIPTQECTLVGLRVAVGAEFEPPEMTILNLPDAPLRVSDARVEHDENGAPVRVGFRVSNTQGGNAATSRVAAYVFQVPALSGPVLRVMADDFDTAVLPGGESRTRLMSLKVPAQSGVTWKIVLVPLTAKMPGHDWQTDDGAAKAKRALQYNGRGR